MRLPITAPPIRTIRTMAPSVKTGRSMLQKLTDVINVPHTNSAITFTAHVAPKIKYAGDPVLHRPARPVDSSEFGGPLLKEIEADMRQIMASKELGPVGLAANQVGAPLQILALQFKDEWMSDTTRAIGCRPVPLTFVANPIVTFATDSFKDDYEVCLSVPGYAAIVPRATKVLVSGVSMEGKPVKFMALDYTARIIQHEYDHLKGILFTERAYINTLRVLENVSMPRPDEKSNPALPQTFASSRKM